MNEELYLDIAISLPI